MKLWGTHKQQPASVVGGREGDRVSNRARMKCERYLNPETPQHPECNEALNGGAKEEDVREEDK